MYLKYREIIIYHLFLLTCLHFPFFLVSRRTDTQYTHSCKHAPAHTSTNTIYHTWYTCTHLYMDHHIPPHIYIYMHSMPPAPQTHCTPTHTSVYTQYHHHPKPLTPPHSAYAGDDHHECQICFCLVDDKKTTTSANWRGSRPSWALVGAGCGIQFHLAQGYKP